VYSRCIGSWAGKSAVTLYQIELPADDLKHYADILKRDFDIDDEATALAAIALFKKQLEQGTEYAIIYRYISKLDMLERPVKEILTQSDNKFSKKAIDAVLSSYASLELGALGYLHKYQVMQHLHVISHMASKRYSSWQHYSDGFVAGKKAWGQQGIGADKVLAGAIKKLHSKEQSPWQMLAWR